MKPGVKIGHDMRMMTEESSAVAEKKHYAASQCSKHLYIYNMLTTSFLKFCHMVTQGQKKQRDASIPMSTFQCYPLLMLVVLLIILTHLKWHNMSCR